MTASPSQNIASIEPGSTEYGDRQKLEAGLAAGGAPTGAPNPAAGGPAPQLDAGTDPLGAILNGSLNPGGSDELTAGLSVGPGPGPLGDTNVPDPKKVRLAQIAETARSPMLRAAARNELRRLAGETA